MSTLVPNSLRSASQRVIRRFTGLHGGFQHLASSISVLLVRRFGAGSRAHTRRVARCNPLIAADSHAARRPLTIKIKGNLAAASAVSGSGAPSGVFTSSSAASDVRALCTGTHPGRLQDGAADGTSAGAVAQLRQVSCQRTACASSPPLNLSCTQAIAEVRPFAGRSRRRCAGKRPPHLLRCLVHARRLTRLADGLF